MGREVERTALTKFNLERPMSPQRRLQLTGCVAVLVAALTFSVGSGFGFFIGRMSSSETVPSASAAVEAPRTLAPEDLDIFWEAMELLEEDFYGDLPSSTERSYGAIHGVLKTLRDKNTGFLNPVEAASFMESIQGSFEGIGAFVEWAEEEGAVRIVEPFEDQPAWNAGIPPR